MLQTVNSRRKAVIQPLASGTMACRGYIYTLCLLNHCPKLLRGDKVIDEWCGIDHLCHKDFKEIHPSGNIFPGCLSKVFRTAVRHAHVTMAVKTSHPNSADYQPWPLQPSFPLGLAAGNINVIFVSKASGCSDSGMKVVMHGLYCPQCLLRLTVAHLYQMIRYPGVQGQVIVAVDHAGNKSLISHIHSNRVFQSLYVRNLLINF